MMKEYEDLEIRILSSKGQSTLTDKNLQKYEQVMNLENIQKLAQTS